MLEASCPCPWLPGPDLLLHQGLVHKSVVVKEGAVGHFIPRC